VLRKHIRIPSDRSARFPTVRELFQLSRIASVRDKRIVLGLGTLAILLFVTAISLGSSALKVTVPTTGGNFTEGVVGIPRFINPILSTSDTDRDLTALVYSGLLRPLPDERFELDLAESYSVSPDGRTYTVILKEDLHWHDGEPITARDVAFTISMAKSDIVRSPKQANWAGVTVETEGDHKIIFRLSEPYTPFLDNLSMGILPEHIWGDVAPEALALDRGNISAVGSGPYEISKIKTDNDNIPTQITLESFRNFALGKPHINSVTFKFFPDEDRLVEAYKRGEVDSVYGISIEKGAELRDERLAILPAELPRRFAIFFNQNRSTVLADKSVRQALSISTPKQDLVAFALRGFGTEVGETSPNLDLARSLLDSAGWKIPEGSTTREKRGKKLSFSLATSDSPELTRAASFLSDSWKNLGIDVSVKVYEVSDLNTDVIRPREFDALLFGQLVGHIEDPYAFWHSGERLDPGLNISGYTNSLADKALEEIRESQSAEIRRENYRIFEKEFQADLPAILLYKPQYTYIPPSKVQNLILNPVGSPADRFLSIYKWYIQTDRVWNIFSR